jgi:hypothetical protein
MRVLVVEVAEVLGVVPQIPVEVAAALEYMEKVQAGLLGLLQAGTVLAQVAVLVAEMVHKRLLAQTFTPQQYCPPPERRVGARGVLIPLRLKWRTVQ